MGGGNPIKKIIKGIGKIVKGITKIVKGVIGFIGDVVGFLVNPFGTFDMPSAPQQADQAAQGVTVTKNGTNVALPVVYGYRRVGGALIHAETGSTNNQYLWCVFAVAEGEIQGFKRIYVDDTALPLPSNFYTHGQQINVTSGKYKDRIRLQVFNGSPGQGQSGLANGSPSWGKKNRKLPDVAYVVMRFYWKEIKTQADSDNNPFGGGIPQVKFDICGKKIYDVRKHTAGTPLISYTGQPKNYSFNPASCLLDYMMNPRYGAGLTYDQIDGDSFRTAALKFEQQVTYNNTYNGRALTMNAVVDTNQKVLDNMKILLAGCRSLMPYSQGKYKIKVEDGGNDTDITSTTINVAMDIDKDKVIGGITMDGERKKTKYNQVVVNYVDPDREFTNQQQIYQVSSDKTTDNDEELKGEFTFHTITNPAIAFEFARMIYLKSRVQRTIGFTGTQELLQLEVGDVIRVTDTILNLSAVTFRVIGIQLNPDMTVSINASEHDATLYPATGGVGQVEIPPQIFTPDPIAIRPRQRKTTLAPIGILPPNDPDVPVDSAGAPIVDSAGIPIVDSAGETTPGDPPEVNPLPEEPEEIFGTAIEDFQTFETLDPLPNDIETNPLRIQLVDPSFEGDVIYWDRAPGSRYVSFSGNSGFCQVPSINRFTGNRSSPGSNDTDTVNGITYLYNDTRSFGGDFHFTANTRALASGAQNVAMQLLINLPQDTSINEFEYTLYHADGIEVKKRVELTQSMNYWQFNSSEGMGRITGARQIKFYWIKKTADGEIKCPDASQMGQSSYFDYNDTQTNKTGTNIEAYLNFYMQNRTTLPFPASLTPIEPAGGDDKFTFHDLGA